MKTLFCLIAVLICFSTSAFGELSTQDLEKIRQIFNEYEARLEKRMSEYEARLEKRMQEQEERFSTDIQALGALFAAEIKGVGKRLDFQGQLMIVLIAAFATAHLGIIFYQNNKRRSLQQEEMERAQQATTEKIEALLHKHAKEMEIMQQQHAAEMKVLHQKIETLEGNLPIVRA